MSSATPKQIAYLSFMGVKGVETFTEAEAAKIIDAGTDQFDGDESRLHWIERSAEYGTYKVQLYPDLYTDPREVKSFLEDSLPAIFQKFVRSKKMVGSSERLTQPKLKKVIETLSEFDENWWKGPSYKESMWEQLQMSFPACCDGRPKAAPQAKKKAAKGGGCMIMMLLILSIGVFAACQ